MTRIVVAGASGRIGRRILELGAGAAAAAPALDLAQPERFDYASLAGGDTVILAAGISSPDACAREPQRARAVNVEGTIGFIEGTLRRGARVVFLSSDTVYGEREDEFDESAPARPAGPYAEMKHAVEARFAAQPAVRVLRLSYVFFSEDPFTKYLRDCAAGGEEAAIFHPFYRAVVHRDDVARAALAMAQRWERVPHAVVNVGGPQVLARTELAELLRHAALPRLRWRVVTPAQEFFLNRPRVIRMRSPRLPELLDGGPRGLAGAIESEFGTK